MKVSRIIACLAGAAALLTPMVVAVSPASAAVFPSCISHSYNYGDLCIFWGQSYNGSHSGVDEVVGNFPVSGDTGYRFLSSGSGKGQYLGNNNGSNRNLDRDCVAILYYSPGFNGPHVTLSPYPQTGYQRAGSQLGILLNNLRSLDWC